MKVNSFADSIVICPRELFSCFYERRRNNPLENFKLFTLEEAINLFAFQYDERAIVYLLKTNSKSTYSYVVDALEAIRFLTKNEYKSEKLNSLVKVRDILIKEGLLWKTPYPEKSFENKQIIVYGYESIRELETLLEKSMQNSIIYDSLDFKPSVNSVFVFNDIYSECHALMKHICGLIEEGISINDIYISGVTSEYINLLKEMSSLYNIPIDMPSNNSLLSTSLVRDFFKQSQSCGFEKGLAFAKENYENDANFEEFEDIINTYKIDSYNFDKQLDIYNEVFGSKRVKHIPLSNCIRILNSCYFPFGSKVCFVNFSLGNAPLLKKDHDYLLDSEKEELGLLPISKLNSMNLFEFNKFILTDSLSFVSRPKFLKESGSLFEAPAVSLRYLSELEVCKTNAVDYSTNYGKFWAANLLDEKNTIGKISEYTKSLVDKCNVYYKEFDQLSDFNSFPIETSHNYSFTSLNAFYECPFKYYCNYILKIGSYTNNLFSVIGNIAHSCLEGCEKGEDFDSIFEASLAREEKTYYKEKYSFKDLFFLRRLKEFLHPMVLFNERFNLGIANKTSVCEESFNVMITDNIKANGRIDKLILSGNNQDNLTIVDYKLNSANHFDADYFTDGLFLQLPFYIFLLKHGESELGRSYAKSKIIGLFFQQYYPDSVTEDKLNELAAGQSDFLKMKGPYIDENGELETLGDKPIIFNYIKKLSEKSNCYNETLFESYSETVKNKILEADSEISAGNFFIRPVNYKTKKSCDYCAFRCVCYRRDNSITVINHKNDEDIEESEEE